MITDIDDFYNNCLKLLRGLCYLLPALSNRPDGQEHEAPLAQCFDREVQVNEKIDEVAFFGDSFVRRGGSVSTAKISTLPFRLTLALLHGKYAFNENSEDGAYRAVVADKSQYFVCRDYLVERWPSNPALLAKFRKRSGEAVVDQILAYTIESGLAFTLFASKTLRKFIENLLP